MLKGYRTLVVNIIVVAGGLIGLEVTPELAYDYVEAFIVVWGGINLLLRRISDTPMFKRY